MLSDKDGNKFAWRGVRMVLADSRRVLGATDGEFLCTELQFNEPVIFTDTETITCGDVLMNFINLPAELEMTVVTEG